MDNIRQHWHWNHTRPCSCSVLGHRHTPSTVTIMYNPAAQIKTAWSATNSAFGKFAVALLYPFIWVQLLWGVALLVNPRLGFECAYHDVSDATGDYMDSLTIGLNIFSLGYCLSAHYYGIQLWNILIFAILGGATAANNYHAASSLLALDGQDECAEAFGEALKTRNIVFSAIVGVLILCSLADWGKGRGKVSPHSSVCLFDPLSQIQARWNETARIFGNLSNIQYYLLVWILYPLLWMEMARNVAVIIDHSNGYYFAYGGAYDGASDAAVILMNRLTVGGALFAIGYLAYVHYHGIKRLNVLTFAAIIASAAINNAVLIARLRVAAFDGADFEEETDAFVAGKQVECVFLSVLVGLMVIGAALDARMAKMASPADEKVPLHKEVPLRDVI